MSPSRQPLQPRRRTFFRPPAVARGLTLESKAILQATEQLSKMSKDPDPGHTRRRTDKGSQVIMIVGPFPSQMVDLCSSSGSSSASSVQRMGDSGMPSPPTTPTRAGGFSAALAASPMEESPIVTTDWVAYSAPLDGDDELTNDVSFSSDMSDIRSVPAMYAPTERAIILPDQPKTPLTPDAAFTQMLLQKLEINTPPKGPRLNTFNRGIQQRQHRQNRFGPMVGQTPNRIIPIPFDASSLISSSSAKSMPRAEVSSARTLVPDDSDRNPNRPVVQVTAEADLFSDSKLACVACDCRENRMFLLRPCGDLVCPACFSSSIAAVSVTQGASKCPACMDRVASFEQYKPGTIVAVRGPRRRAIPVAVDDDKSYETTGQTIAMRIDNVAWDIEPSIVERFLPAGSLPVGHPQPIHICIDRRDGRTKDFMYMEVASQAAARRVLQTRQNAFMPGGRVTGGRKRAVTITQVTHHELLQAIRPNTKNELDSLLELCEAALSTPAPQLHVDANGRGRLHPSIGINGKVHYLKYRHAPFHVLISLMCKMNGTESPVYWDLFRIASGAISVLANSLKNSCVDTHGDRALLARLNRLFDLYFRTRPEA